MEAYVERQIVAGRYTSAGGAQPELHELQDSVPNLLLTGYGSAHSFSSLAMDQNSSLLMLLIQSHCVFSNKRVIQI